MTDKDWWSPGQITFRREHNLFLLRNFELIIDGIWPSDHKDCGYSGKKGRQRGHSASFEKVAQVTAELVTRLYRVGRDALPLLITYSQDLEQQYYIRDFLARCMKIEVTELDKRIESALKYISGKNKDRSYKEFLQHKKGGSNGS